MVDVIAIDNVNVIVFQTGDCVCTGCSKKIVQFTEAQLIAVITWSTATLERN